MNVIPEAAVWRGGPSKSMVRFLLSLLRKDAHENPMFQPNPGTWKRLRTDQDYAALNRIVDGQRRRNG